MAVPAPTAAVTAAREALAADRSIAALNHLAALLIDQGELNEAGDILVEACERTDHQDLASLALFVVLLVDLGGVVQAQEALECMRAAADLKDPEHLRHLTDAVSAIDRGLSAAAELEVYWAFAPLRERASRAWLDES